MTTFSPPYRAAHPNLSPYTYAIHRKPTRPSKTPRYIHPSYTDGIKKQIEDVRIWQLKQFSKAHAQALDIGAFEPGRYTLLSPHSLNEDHGRLT